MQIGIDILELKFPVFDIEPRLILKYNKNSELYWTLNMFLCTYA